MMAILAGLLTLRCLQSLSRFLPIVSVMTMIGQMASLYLVSARLARTNAPVLLGSPAGWVMVFIRHYDAARFSVDGERPLSRPFRLAALAVFLDAPPFRPRRRIHAVVPRFPGTNAGTYSSASSREKC